MGNLTPSQRVTRKCPQKVQKPSSSAAWGTNVGFLKGSLSRFLLACPLSAPCATICNTHVAAAAAVLCLWLHLSARQHKVLWLSHSPPNIPIFPLSHGDCGACRGPCPQGSVSGCWGAADALQSILLRGFLTTSICSSTPHPLPFQCSAERGFSIRALQNRISRESLLTSRTRRKSLKNKHKYLKPPDRILRKESMLSLQETGVFGPNNRCSRGGSLAGISLKQCTAPRAASFPMPSLEHTELAEWAKVTHSWHLSPPWDVPRLPLVLLLLFLSQAPEHITKQLELGS